MSSLPALGDGIIHGIFLGIMALLLYILFRLFKSSPFARRQSENLYERKAKVVLEGILRSGKGIGSEKDKEKCRLIPQKRPDDKTLKRYL